MATFRERFFHFLDVTSPRTLFSNTAEIKEAASVLRLCKEQGLQCGSDSDMKGYQRLVDATMHPVTGDLIPAPFRVSAIAPVNIPIVYLMLTTPSTNLPMTMFLHWVNQSYNSVCNLCNSAGGGGADRGLQEGDVKAYVLATTSACALAFGLGKAFERAPASVRRFGVVIPCLATAAANCSNLAFTRMGEITQGAQLHDESGRAIDGLSPKAGVVCVAQTALTRCVLVPAACLLLPPVAMHGLRSLRLAPTGPRALVILELAIIYSSLQAALPAALAVFPQSAAFPVAHLEEKFQGLLDMEKRPIKTLYANKGL